MKECQDKAMTDWEDMPTKPKQARKKKEFTEETAKKYWKMRAADFVREKRAGVLHNNREDKKQATRRANREGMAMPPPQEPPEEGEVKSRITNLWWFENELRTTDMRAQAALEALEEGTQNMESVRTHEYAMMKDEKVTMICMQKGMTVSKAGTESLAAAVTVNQCIYTDKDWLDDVREKSACREDFAEVVGAARSAELAENAGAGRVYVVMGEPKAVRNAHEARVLGKDMLLWRARDETHKEIIPEGMAAPTERTAEDLNKIVDSWLQHGELGTIAKRQTAFNFAYGKREPERT
jgi:hypothetical protein